MVDTTPASTDLVFRILNEDYSKSRCLQPTRLPRFNSIWSLKTDDGNCLHITLPYIHL